MRDRESFERQLLTCITEGFMTFIINAFIVNIVKYPVAQQ